MQGYFDTKRKKLLFFSLTALGISSITTQILVMRELLSVFYGNELVLGIILANWLLITGIGAYIGRFSDRIKGKLTILAIAQTLIAILPAAYLVLIRNMRGIFFFPGEMIGLGTLLFSTFVLLLPYCLASGFLFTLTCTAFSDEKRPEQIGQVYFIDTLGGVLGGFLFSFVLIFLLNPFQIAYLLFFVNIIAALLISLHNRNRLLIAADIILAVLMLTVILNLDLDDLSTRNQYRGQELVFQKDTPYGKIVVTKLAGQMNFFENGISLFTTDNTISNEEIVHYAMAQHPNPETVLLISGGAAGTTSEISKYGVERIDYVELDPEIIRLGKEYTSNLDDKKINIINTDGRSFVKQATERYDVVIVDLPDPSTAQINRFYTLEFFREIKKLLNQCGVISIRVVSSENYLNKENIRLLSSLYNTLDTEFANILIIPGEYNFLIASDDELSYNISNLIEAKNISTSYVNEYYLKGKLTKERIDNINSVVDKDAAVNKDFKPVAYYYHLLYWASYFSINLKLIIIALAVLIMAYMIRLKPIPFVIFTAGFAASSLEVVILIGFQIIYGYVYSKIGIIIAAFMLGLAIGSYHMNKYISGKSKKDLVRIQFLIAVYSILLPFALILISKIETNVLAGISSQLLMPLLALLIAALVGAEFPLASKLCFNDVARTAGGLYNADMVGAGVGAAIVSAFLIPVAGIVNVCILIGVLNLISCFIVWRFTH